MHSQRRDLHDTQVFRNEARRKFQGNCFSLEHSNVRFEEVTFGHPRFVVPSCREANHHGCHCAAIRPSATIGLNDDVGELRIQGDWISAPPCASTVHRQVSDAVRNGMVRPRKPFHWILNDLWWLPAHYI